MTNNMDLYSAAANGNLDEVSSILDSGDYDINCQNINGNTPLYIAAAWGLGVHFEIVKLLVEHNADVNLANEKGNTPLYVAACWGHYNVVKYLIGHQANINAQMEHGRTPLHIAAITPPHISVNPQDNRKYANYKSHSKLYMYKNALEYIRKILGTRQHSELFPNLSQLYETLVAPSVNLHDFPDKVFDIIVSLNHFATVEVLLEAGAALGIRDTDEETVLTKAMYSKHEPMVKYLVQKGATV